MITEDIMSGDVITVEPKATVREASQKMRTFGIGTLVVVEGNYPVGIITERDITYRVVARDLNPSTYVEYVMTTELITVDTTTPVERIIETMVKHNFRRLPVLEKGKLAGIVSIRDIIRQPKLEKSILEELTKLELW